MTGPGWERGAIPTHHLFVNEILLECSHIYEFTYC